MSEAANQALASSTSTPMIVNCAAYSDGARLRDLRIEEIPKVLASDAQFVWLGLYEPSEEVLREVQSAFGLHDLAIEDAHRAHQRPKVEEYGNQIFVVLRTAQLIDEQVEFGETHIFVGPKHVVSVRHGASLSYAAVRTRCESTPRLLRLGPAFILYAIMDFIVDNYFPILDVLEDKLGELEEQIFRGRVGRESAERIYDFKRDLVAFKRAVMPLVEMCNRLIRFDLAVVPAETHPYFRDVYDHVLRINETVDNLRDLLSGALEANLSLIGVNQNEEMRKLAAWAAILAVPTMLAGVYGMNFEFMPELHWRYGYALVLGAMGCACGWLYWHFKRAHWL